MSGIVGKLNQVFKNENPPAKTEITMQDIALAKTGSMTARALGILQLAAQGKVVNDKAVQEFLGQHLGMSKLGEVSTLFEEHAQINASSNDSLSKKEIKQERKDTAALAKVFDRAASGLLQTVEEQRHIGNFEHLGEYKDELKAFRGSLNTTQNIAEGMKNLERYKENPALLLRAALYNGENNQGAIQKDFIQFLKTYSGGGDVKTAYSAFIEAKKGSADRYVNDKNSTIDYQAALEEHLLGMLPNESASQISKMKDKELIEKFGPKIEKESAQKTDELFGIKIERQKRNIININAEIGEAESYNEVGMTGSKILPPVTPGGSLTNTDFDKAKTYIENFKRGATDDQSNYTQENQQFLYALTELDGIDPAQRGPKIDEIMTRYILVGGDRQINIDGPMRQALEQKWTKEP